ncbi:hypothetical protein M3223_03990 [Paenibacillus pasadenensis]|nr:hypothetical protein [Paenibacillus pasadenensis]MCM3746509.1 hypothetical protein [Paenibacillus pasadenensis]
MLFILILLAVGFLYIISNQYSIIKELRESRKLLKEFTDELRKSDKPG